MLLLAEKKRGRMEEKSLKVCLPSLLYTLSELIAKSQSILYSGFSIAVILNYATAIQFSNFYYLKYLHSSIHRLSLAIQHRRECEGQRER